MVVAMNRLLACALVAAACAAGCDARATSAPAAVAQVKSKALESCAATADCEDGLRCFGQTCQPAARSAVGDYLAAVGAAASARGDHEAALAAYAEALGRYEGDKLKIPPDVDCAYGDALALAKANKEHAELAARVLHRCVLAVPPGSALWHHALTILATLHDSGLEPASLGRPQLADRYLTRAPSKPADDKLAITVTASPTPTGKTFQAIPDRIAEGDLHAALVACGDSYTAATKKPALSVDVAVKAVYVASEYEDESGSFSIKVDPPAVAPPGADGTAEGCVRAALTAALPKLTTVRDAFATKLTIVIK
jgi:tetratricopeptide (TPR) repeat protein